jgi:hypothetical protein
MNNINFLVLSFALLLLTSCKKEVEPPKLIYNNQKVQGQKAIATDTSQIEIADLPIHFEGTKFLLFPIGDYRINDKRSSYATASYSGSFTISNNNEFEITGFLNNLKFQSVDADSIYSLTDKRILIQTATYLKNFAAKSKRQIMVYTLADNDTNIDGKLDDRDIKSIYLSEISGLRFTKISAELEELIDWNVIEVKNRLYFRTIEDTNKNGQFDQNDPVHYNFIDLLSADWKVQNYKPN